MIDTKNILIVEDEVLILQSLKLLIEAKGHRVKTVSNGQDAIKHIKEQSYDKIVCDLMLQDISGFDIIEETIAAKGIDEVKEKFIIISAYLSPQIVERASSYGCLFISKPFGDIQATIDKILNHS